MRYALTKEDLDCTIKNNGRFLDYAQSSPTDVDFYLQIRLVPTLYEFEEQEGKNGWITCQMKRWLTSYQSRFNLLALYDDEINDRKWETATAAMCKSEVQNRHNILN